MSKMGFNSDKIIDVEEVVELDCTNNKDKNIRNLEGKKGVSRVTSFAKDLCKGGRLIFVAIIITALSYSLVWGQNEFYRTGVYLESHPTGGIFIALLISYTYIIKKLIKRESFKSNIALGLVCFSFILPFGEIVNPSDITGMGPYLHFAGTSLGLYGTLICKSGSV